MPTQMLRNTLERNMPQVMEAGKLELH
ncbi:hypothetical protein AGR4B_Lc70149 [Agrobacterium tumefaciens str. CFBP 5621]|nr:hypothetical protein AGR4B_Lc70149 [Agrobacterium tumefaciens str. CFBP 5621]